MQRKGQGEKTAISFLLCQESYQWPINILRKALIQGIESNFCTTALPAFINPHHYNPFKRAGLNQPEAFTVYQ